MLKISVAHRKRLINNQHIGPHRRRQGKGQTHLHPAGIDAHRLVDIVANFGERLDFRQ